MDMTFLDDPWRNPNWRAHETNTFDQLNHKDHKHMITNGLRFIDESRINALMNQNRPKTSN